MKTPNFYHKTECMPTSASRRSDLDSANQYKPIVTEEHESSNLGNMHVKVESDNRPADDINIVPAVTPGPFRPSPKSVELSGLIIRPRYCVKVLRKIARCIRCTPASLWGYPPLAKKECAITAIPFLDVMNRAWKNSDTVTFTVSL